MYVRLGLVRRTDGEGEPFLAIHEIYCDEQDKVVAISEDPVPLAEGSVEEMVEMLEELKEDCEGNQVLEWADHRHVEWDEASGEVVYAAHEPEDMPAQTHPTHYWMN